MASKQKTDPRVDKRRVTMRRYSVMVMNGEPQMMLEEAVDYVRPDHLQAYLDVVTPNWQTVEVSEEPDAGPGGYEGQTYVPPELDVPDAGTTYPALEV